ncbi:MAG: DUF4124 domain-containing protein [Desulfuromonadales bacterium]|nr:MAG: DUF4124 domain-containing protein [Desulfuromonadales bacterium]
MKSAPITLFLVFVCVFSAGADTYRWVDDKGVVSYTDDPDRVPAKFLKRLERIPSPAVPPVPVTTPQSPPQAEPQTPKASTPVLYGGLDENGWRGKFGAIRNEIKAIEDGLPAKNEQLNTLHRKRVIYQRPQDRVAYNQLKEQVDRDEARVKELQDKLSALDQEASKAGVPGEWRQ